MPARRSRPPLDADERTSLLGWYDLQRGIVVLKCQGLSDEDAHRVLVPTSPLMTVAGIVSHLACAEDLWFREVLLGEWGEGPGLGPHPQDDADFVVDGVTLDEALERYAAACARSDAAIAAHSLDDRGSTACHPVGDATVRWMVHHMLEETARHAGHLDLLRELLDGETGYF
ncbi:DinB family protein [Phycicoccus flavus]|uniref:DinB family protein n=1 Tax=Phycicoccus flavus TaxID=2502783 RepID=UPI000FEC0F96|nr:DinB family protein [Phycicoccus flavus]NHA69191.1 DUF664 domain-containing protein [Phycicoccus flavus]